MPVFTQNGRVFLARALYDSVMFLAVGQGDAAWDNLPPPANAEEQMQLDAEMSAQTGLVAQVGVTRLREKYYVKPDPAGTIIMADGAAYSKSVDPTAHVFVRFQLDLSDAVGTTLREAGIMIGTAFAAGVPEGQMFMPNTEITNIGTMIQVDRFQPIVRDGSISQSLTFVITV
ncbi:hypothetical protein HNQ68_001974 [Pseudochrobactrum saccharolyticum]|uniref:Uncharacterized protein n=1 Tax=Pseudochrobactrum saccharolyticum TaxID=354352 RepID=A0A7W8ALT8_9HYPH|nr:hypothetical protein [Pseudochrobactrum saccharolyticum]KAB0538197.1 hypothetical protein F7P81_10770 [Pseudochrobactrum saccharolyticum]MBB5091433.1 hypothetical protein [Pseudochrobactrum saccharolyticum]